MQQFQKLCTFAHNQTWKLQQKENKSHAWELKWVLWHLCLGSFLRCSYTYMHVVGAVERIVLTYVGRCQKHIIIIIQANFVWETSTNVDEYFFLLSSQQPLMRHALTYTYTHVVKVKLCIKTFYNPSSYN